VGGGNLKEWPTLRPAWILALRGLLAMLAIELNKRKTHVLKK
jgi:hypothetical protein